MRNDESAEEAILSPKITKQKIIQDLQNEREQKKLQKEQRLREKRSPSVVVHERESAIKNAFA